MSANPRSARQRFWGEAYREGVEAVDEGGRCGRSSSPEARFVAGNVGGGGAVAVRLRQHVREREDEKEGDGTEEVAARPRGEIYGLREIAVADQLRARSPRQIGRAHV